MFEFRFVLLLAILTTVRGASSNFNEAFAASIVANIEQLTTLPWSRVNNVLYAAFNSRWSYLYTGDGVSSASGPDGFVQYVDKNHTQAYLWSIFKGFSYEESSSIDMIYTGFENGMFIGYSNPSPGELYIEDNGNMSCPEFNITSRCRATYGGDSTSTITGQISGGMTFAKVYDPRLRVWYTDSMEGGSVWTDPYAFAEYNVLGVTAATQIITDNGQVIGVFGTDYTLNSIETVLINEVEDNEDFVLFIVDNKGLLIAASISGVAVDADLNQVPANASSIEIINKISKYIEEEVGGWIAANGTVLTVDITGEGLYWAQSTELTDEYGLHWHVVVAELVSCDIGYFTPPTYKSTDCKECIHGAECPGGSSLPYPTSGFWVDRSEYGYGDVAYECQWDTCLGFKHQAKELSNKNNNNNDDDEYYTELYNCWIESSFNSSICNSDDLMCQKGSTGVLCGSCISSYTYNSALRACIACDSDTSIIPAYIILSFIGLIIFSLFLFIIKDSKFFGGGGYGVTLIKLEVMKNHLLSYPPFSILKHIDRGMIKVVWATSQIIGTISWNLGVRYPQPFDKLLSVLAFLQLDFFALDCQYSSANYLTRVYFNSMGPIILSFLCLMVYLIRRMMILNKHAVDYDDLVLDIYNQHLYFFLLLGFLVLPTISMLQFAGLECIHLKDGNSSSYLRVDTSINCNSNEYKIFVIIDSIFIFIYQSVPLLWFILLYRVKNKLNPQGAEKYKNHNQNNGQKQQRISIGRQQHQVEQTALNSSTFGGLLSDHVKEVMRGRKGDISIQHLGFLWQDYVPNRWYYEVLEMYRRIVFIAAIPLLGNDGAMRATIGCILSIIMIGFVREASPFIRGATNVLNSIAQYQILVTFFGAFIIVTGALSTLGLTPFVLGCLLFIVNLFIVALVGGWSLSRYWYELKEKRWRKALNVKEFEILNHVMEENQTIYFGKSAPNRQSTEQGKIWERAKSMAERAGSLFPGGHHHGSGGNHASVSRAESIRKSRFGAGGGGTNAGGAVEMSSPQTKHDGHSEEEKKGKLGKYLLKPKDVVMSKKIGAGAFGEVFKGTYKNESVAVKTMIEVTEKTARMFRAEILLTSQLRHPNIVNFIGACWSRELTCLVLEWVSKGTLGELLDGEMNHKLTWEDPLLKLAIEMCQGMAYLHSTSLVDLITGQTNEKDIILHRDLKPENVLITEFLSSKITDFGTSRAKDENENATMSAVGTPLYCAGEIVRGEVYDEKVDIYSFGLILMDMAVQIPLIDFIGLRWRTHYRKKQAPKQAMRFIRSMTEDGWRPIGQSPPFPGDKKTSKKKLLAKSQSLKETSSKNDEVTEVIEFEKFDPSKLQKKSDILIPNIDIEAGGEDESKVPIGLDQTPRSIEALIIKCIDHDPKKRPSFQQILKYLENEVSDEIKHNEKFIGFDLKQNKNNNKDSGGGGGGNKLLNRKSSSNKEKELKTSNSFKSKTPNNKLKTSNSNSSSFNKSPNRSRSPGGKPNLSPMDETITGGIYI